MEFPTETQDHVAAPEESIVIPDIDTLIQNQIADEMARESIETAASDTTAGGSFDHSEHIGQCSGSPGASTPPSSPRPSNTREPHQTAACPASPMVEIPVEMREHNALHLKAISLRPVMPADRYCIGVLNPAKLPKNVRKEEDFLWMKGHGVCIVFPATYHEPTTRASPLIDTWNFLKP